MKVIATKQQLLHTLNKLSKPHLGIVSSCLLAAWNDMLYDQSELDRALIALDIYAQAQNNFAILCTKQPEQSQPVLDNKENINEHQT